jgi:hypothetical protein
LRGGAKRGREALDEGPGVHAQVLH